ncbi:hypothetical protein EXN65_20235 [Clostridium botulinum]|uniref:hypothetical protein n=1 Tax=Clostridium botulinum TaxID=1491 RepID=UPI00016BBB7B|nr:hypothetical protein [Clostridium botulinum]EDT83784.1 hypothetical protein CBB_A0050 [Clostridium botulinum Bf]MBY6882550.1 hypothetical protein [Clostridium botulinum]NEZ88368.1 hypothetical protein [Clostridium botulinum]NFB02801.1 hypothetical protein [Clostridium botulinum]NFE32735.1 hypothetical protein [Clostridium botulinum]
MFVDTKITKNIDGEEQYDKFALSLSVFDISFKGSTCSLLEGQILNDCKACNLEPICKKVDGIIEEYTEDTSVVKEEFNF